MPTTQPTSEPELRPTTERPPLRLGERLILLAGLVPFFAGVSGYVLGHASLARSEGEWMSAVGPLGFTFAEIERASAALSAYFQLASSVGSVNVTAAAGYVWIVCWFGLRKGEKWAWYALLFSLIWVGGNDAAAAIRYTLETGIPFMLAPISFCVLMIAGLGLTRRAVFVAK
jgi:hypothetical protein